MQLVICSECGTQNRLPDTYSSDKRSVCGRCKKSLVYQPSNLPMKQRKNAIRFNCPTCSGPLEATLLQAGDDINCPVCNSPITIPRIPNNPYSRPIATILRQMRAVPIGFPYFPQIIQITVLSVVMVILALLYVTIGLAAQVCGVFEGLILDAHKQMQEGSGVERSAQAISICLYLLFILPFWIIQFPFSFIGSLWSSYRFGSFVILLLFIALAVAVKIYWQQLSAYLHPKDNMWVLPNAP